MKTYGNHSQVWWHISIILALGRLMQDCELKASLGYVGTYYHHDPKKISSA
jgi:hypothetical protein